MNIPDLQLRTAYYSLLNEAVSSSGSPVKVYDVVPVAAPYPYIRLSNQSNVENTCKGGNGFSSTIVVDIATHFSGGFGVKKQSDQIANQIYGMVMYERHSLIMPDFYNIDTNLSNSGTFEEDDGKFIVLRKILTFTHILSEK